MGVGLDGSGVDLSIKVPICINSGVIVPKHHLDWEIHRNLITRCINLLQYVLIN